MRLPGRRLPVEYLRPRGEGVCAHPRRAAVSSAVARSVRAACAIVRHQTGGPRNSGSLHGRAKYQLLPFGPRTLPAFPRGLEAAQSNVVRLGDTGPRAPDPPESWDVASLGRGGGKLASAERRRINPRWRRLEGGHST